MLLVRSHWQSTAHVTLNPETALLNISQDVYFINFSLTYHFHFAAVAVTGIPMATMALLMATEEVTVAVMAEEAVVVVVIGCPTLVPV